MNPVYFVPIFMMFLVLFTTRRERKNILKKILNKRNSEDKTEMVQLAQRFIDKECLIYTVVEGQVTGTIKEVSDGAILVERSDSFEAVNLDFVVRIREYPRKKNGKKKSVIFD